MIDKKLYFYTISLLLFSIVAVYSLSIFATIHFDTSQYTFVKKQFIAVIISIISIYVISKMNPNSAFKLLGFTIFIISFLAIIIMLFLPHQYVNAVLGAKRWIKIGHFSIAPTEFFKYGFIFFISWSLSRKIKIFQDCKSFLQELLIVLPYFMLLLVAVAIIAIGQKDLGQVVVIFTILMGLLFISGRSKKFFFYIGIFIVSLIYLLIQVAPHRLERFKGWWVWVQNSIPFIPDSLKVHDRLPPLHIINSTDAIASGGFLGKGLGDGIYKLGFLSEVHTDFILSGLSEEIGFLGLFVAVILFVAILYRIFVIANSLEDLSQKLFAYGVAISLFASFIINAYGISGIIPIKGIAVPLLSYGGSQIIATSIAIGMVLMLSKVKGKGEYEKRGEGG